MKKTLTLLSIVFITLLSLKANAQDEPVEYTHSYIAFLLGTSVPKGNFGAYDYSNYKAGFAKPGFNLSFDAAYYVYKNLAITANFSFQDQGELTTDDAQNLANGYNTDFNKDNTEITGVGRYHNITFMVGPQYTFVYHRLSFDIRASAGLLKSSTTPTIAVVFNNATNTDLTFNQLSSNSGAFAYGGSAGLRFNLGGRWDLSAKETFVKSEGLGVENTNNPGTTGRFVTQIPITVLQTTFGFTYHFGTYIK